MSVRRATTILLAGVIGANVLALVAVATTQSAAAAAAAIAAAIGAAAATLAVFGRDAVPTLTTGAMSPLIALTVAAQAYGVLVTVLLDRRLDFVTYFSHDATDQIFAALSASIVALLIAVAIERDPKGERDPTGERSAAASWVRFAGIVVIATSGCAAVVGLLAGLTAELYCICLGLALGGTAAGFTASVGLAAALLVNSPEPDGSGTTAQTRPGTVSLRDRDEPV